MKDFIEISSKDNKYIKLVSKLQKSSKERYAENLFVIEGLRICSDAFENNIRFLYLFVSKTFYNKMLGKNGFLIENSENLFLIPDSLFEKISDTDSPQGVLAVAKMPKNSFSFEKKGRFLALDNLQDPSNLGAVARSCEALGVNGIIVSENTCDPYSPKSLRASMGTLIRIPLFITDDLPSFFVENGLRVFSCVVDRNAKNIADVSFSDGDVIVIGNEANGISDKVKEISDFLITIRMKGKAESLNAAAAAAIAVYELTL